MRDLYEPTNFTFKANDGQLDSALATMTLLVTNLPPVANSQSLTSAEDTAKAITLSGNDPEGWPLNYRLTTLPAHGQLSGSVSNYTYTPAQNYNGRRPIHLCGG